MMKLNHRMVRMNAIKVLFTIKNSTSNVSNETNGLISMSENHLLLQALLILGYIFLSMIVEADILSLLRV